MRILANENIPREAVDVLRAGGHDVVWIRTEWNTRISEKENRYQYSLSEYQVISGQNIRVSEYQVGQLRINALTRYQQANQNISRSVGRISG